VISIAQVESIAEQPLSRRHTPLGALIRHQLSESDGKGTEVLSLAQSLIAIPTCGASDLFRAIPTRLGITTWVDLPEWSARGASHIDFLQKICVFSSCPRGILRAFPLTTVNWNAKLPTNRGR
jgi:hypothetical protein